MRSNALSRPVLTIVYEYCRIGHQYSGRSLRKIGEKFGIGESAVFQPSRRFAWEMTESRTLRGRVEGVKKTLGLSRV